MAKARSKKSQKQAPLVGVIMGSKSDWETLRHGSEVLDQLRTETLPGLVDGPGLSVHVTGGTAMTDDVSQRLQDRMPLFLAVVIGLSFLLLVMVFRSVLVPAKAARDVRQLFRVRKDMGLTTTQLLRCVALIPWVAIGVGVGASRYVLGLAPPPAEQTIEI